MTMRSEEYMNVRPQLIEWDLIFFFTERIFPF